MKIVESLLNRSEELVFRELQQIASDNSMRVFVKPRLSDVIDKQSSRLTRREFDFYTRSHLDFVLSDSDARPFMAVEFDGPNHAHSMEQSERDKIKNELCRQAGLGLLRINDQYVTRLYGGMSVLRWIVEVAELQKAFGEAQDGGQIPLEETFDPASMMTIVGKKGFPYWLSASSTQSINSFIRSLGRDVPKGWASLVGTDANDASRRLSFIHFGGRVLQTSTGVRKQDVDFPDYELLSELDSCDMGETLKHFLNGAPAAISVAEFRPIFERFCERYQAQRSHSAGAFPFETPWT